MNRALQKIEVDLGELNITWFKFKTRHTSADVWQNLSIQPENRLVLLWWPPEGKVALSEQCCSWWRCSLNWETDGGLPTLLMNMSLGSSLTDSCQKSNGLGQHRGEIRLYLWLYGPFPQLAFFCCSREETANPSLTSESANFWPHRHFLCHILSKHLFLYRDFLQTSIVKHTVQGVTFFRYPLWVPMPHFHGNKGRLSVFVFWNNAVLHCCVGLYHNLMNSHS